MRNLLVITGLAMLLTASAKEPPVGMFDLKYTLLYNLDDSAKVLSLWDDIHAVATLQGVVNREQPRLFLDYVCESGRSIDMYWWSKYRRQGEWLHGRDTIVYPTIEALVTAFSKYISGVVLYDTHVAATSNVASAIAGVENLIALRYDPAPQSLYSRLVLSGPKLPVRRWLVNENGSPLFTGHGLIAGTTRKSSGSAKNDTYLWFLEHYMKKGKCSGRYAAYYIDQQWRKNPRATVVNHHTLTNHDFFVSRRAFFFDLSPWGDEAATDDLSQPCGTDLATLKELLLEAYRLNKGEAFCHIGGFPAWAFKYTRHAGGQHEDVATEWEFSRIISAYNAFKDADAIGYGALANASFWQHFPLDRQYPQPWVTQHDLQARGYLDKNGRVDFRGRNFIIFYVGDYDASAWITQLTPTIWNNPDRGKLPMMWCVSPVLQERAPQVMHYLRHSASPRDYFAASDNGAGYLMPGMLQVPRDISGLPDGLAAWASHCKPYYNRWGLTVTGFIIDGLAPALNNNGLDCYASFSPNGIVPQKAPLTSLHGNMPVLRADEDIQQEPHQAAARIVERVNARKVPFHWFRNILKSPTWYVQLTDELQRIDPSIELLDAPVFFELYRIWLKQELNNNDYE